MKNSRCKALARKSEYCGETWIYRGQGNSEWEITSTLQREIKIDPTNIISFERDMRGKELAAIQNFKALAWKYVPDPDMTYLEWLMLMRHYGVPTRLVDFTESPTVALHFAIETEPVNDFAVWAINRDRLKDAYIQAQVGTKLPGWDEMSKTYGERVMDEALEACTDLPLVKSRLQILHDIGLGYLTLGEETPGLSGGEAQRLKLASEMGRGQGDSVFVFDEPTIGLHPLDVRTLMEVFRHLIGNGATVIVIEHDLDVIRSADWIVDMGPGGGKAGGRIVAIGTPSQIKSCSQSVTGRYI